MNKEKLNQDLIAIALQTSQQMQNAESVAAKEFKNKNSVLTSLKERKIKMKTGFNLFLITILITVSEISFSQNRDWISSYHFASDDANSVTADYSGNVYVTGSSGGRIATVKYNSAGIQQWAVRYSAPGNNTAGATDIAVDDSGNVYVTGAGYSPVTGNDYVTIKYSPAGLQRWVMILGGTGSGADLANSIAVDDSGNVYVTGFTYRGSISFQDYTTVKYNSNGVHQWSKYYNGTGSGADYASSIALDASGNIYVTGYSKGSGTSDDDYVTIKYDPSGAEQWIRIYQGPGDAFDQAQSIAVDNYANVYITGRSDGGTVTHYDYATIKYNSSGDSLWVRRYDGSAGNFDYGKSVAVDASGNVYVTGQSYYSSSNYDFATVKYNSLGVFQWDRIYDGPGNSADNISSMILDNAGNIYITGSSYLAGENYNYATVKYNSLGIEQWSDIYNGAEGGSDESFSIAADNSGNVYITGSSYAGVEFKNYVTIKYSNGNSPLTLNLTAFIEGFYDNNVNSMISDTARIYLRNNLSPYNIIDSSKGLFSSSGTGVFLFSNALNSVNYYIVIKHRNAVETWSSSGNSFLSDSLSYDFSTSGLKAYGNNMVSVDISPVRYALYSGDIDQDGFVNLTDVINIYNDASGFLTGYNSTDLNGNSIVDLTDLIIAYNNSAGFVSTIIP